MRRMLRASSWPAALVLLAACGSSSKQAAELPPAPAPPAQPLAAAPPSQTVVTLIEAGAAPRRALRYAMPASYDRTLAMVMRMRMGMEMGANPAVTVDVPPMRLLTRIGVEERLGDSEVRCRYEISSAEVQPGPPESAAMREELAGKLKSFVGTRGGMRVDHRGRASDVTMVVPDGVAPDIRSALDSSRRAMEQLAAPLPSEPVGVGARWRVVQRLDFGGMVMTQTVDFRLVAAEGDVLTIESSGTQSAAAQPIRNPDMPAGTSAELISLAGTLTGKTRVDLRELVPLEATVSGTADTDMTVTGNGQGMRMKIHLETDIDMRRE